MILFCFLIADKEDFGREVVRIAVEKRSACKRAPRIALAAAFGVLQEILVEHIGAIEVPAILRTIGETARYDYLVEEIPLTLIGERADAGVELAPERIEELMLADALCVALRSEHLRTRFVHRVVVKVTHYYNPDVGIDAPERVGDLLRQRSRSLAVGR